jgi:4-amino-4-deoxy-L-arabinose transferase-like glycosyltransferase
MMSDTWRGSFVPVFLVGLVALVFRLADLGGFVTIDEAKFWLPRSDQFFRAVLAGDFAAIPLVGHPGVTTMWLGAAGNTLRRFLFEHRLLHHETYGLVLAFYRLPLALVHSAGVLLGYGLLRRMFSPALALLAALLWAADPFVLAYSRIIHVDGLMGTFATLSVLAACYFWNHGGGRVWLIVSGVCLGLAVLSKSPALALGPVVGGLALTAGLRRGIPFWRGLWPFLAWGLVGTATTVALWPVMWAEPTQAYHALRYGIESEGGQPHMWGNFFLGRAVDVPGPSFYPVVLALRTTPWTLAGLLFLPLALRWGGGKSAFEKEVSSGEHNAAIRDLAVLAAFVVLFVVVMSLFPKKHNRYLEPVFPALDILAASGLVWGVGWLARRVVRRFPSAVLTRATVGIVGLAAVLNAAWWHPYGVVAYNPVLGGARAGAQTFLAGWGEGFGQVAAWLNAQPDMTGVVVVTELRSVLHPYLREGAYAAPDEGGALPDRAGYVVVYLSHVQRHLSRPYSQFHGHAPPVHTVTLHGVEYAWVYQVPRPLPHMLEALFGPLIKLKGYAVDTSAIRSSGVLSLTLQWQPQAPIAKNYHLFVHVMGQEGERVGQIDIAAGREPAGTAGWQPGRYIRRVYPVAVPADIPSGSYFVSIGLYHPDNFARLPLHGPPQSGTPDDGPDALFLEPVHIE